MEQKSGGRDNEGTKVPGPVEEYFEASEVIPELDFSEIGMEVIDTRYENVSED
jgi:hypothetical protein